MSPISRILGSFSPRVRGLFDNIPLKLDVLNRPKEEKDNAGSNQISGYSPRTAILKLVTARGWMISRGLRGVGRTGSRSTRALPTDNHPGTVSADVPSDPDLFAPIGAEDSQTEASKTSEQRVSSQTPTDEKKSPLTRSAAGDKGNKGDIVDLLSLESRVARNQRSKAELWWDRQNTSPSNADWL